MDTKTPFGRGGVYFFEAVHLGNEQPLIFYLLISVISPFVLSVSAYMALTASFSCPADSTTGSNAAAAVTYNFLPMAPNAASTLSM